MSDPTASTTPQPPELWTVDQLADYLGVGRNTIYGLTRYHRIRYIRVGKTVRFRPVDVAAWLESEVVQATGPAPAAPRVRQGRRRARDMQ